MAQSKKCCICKQIKRLILFYKDCTKKDNHSDTCAQCSREYSKKYQLAHANDVKAYGKLYRLKNKESIKKTIKKYYKQYKKRLLAYRQKYRIENKYKVKEQQKNYRLNNVDKIRNHDLLASHNITLTQYNDLWNNQNGVCAICHKPEIEFEKGKSARKLCVDHNHQTGKIRALLCGKCNKAIGLFYDDVNLLSSAITYLEKHNVST